MSASSAARRTSCIATTATARISPTSRPALGLNLDRRLAPGVVDRLRQRRRSRSLRRVPRQAEPPVPQRRRPLYRRHRRGRRRRSAQVRRRGLVRHRRRRRSRSLRREPERRRNGLFRNDGGRFVDVAREWGVDAPRPLGGVRRRRRQRWPISTATVFSICSSRTTGRARCTATIGGRTVRRRDQRQPACSSSSMRRRRRGATTTTTAVRICTSPAFWSTSRTIPIICFTTTRGRRHGAFRRRAAGARQRPRRQPRRAVGGFRLRRRPRPRADEQRPGGRALSVQEPAAGRTRAPSLSVDVVDARGRHTKRAPKCGSMRQAARRLVSSGLVDTGGGYCSQNVMPVHVATGRRGARRRRGRPRWGRAAGESTKVSGVDPMTAPRPLVLRISD